MPTTRRLMPTAIRDEGGFALILVLGFTAVLGALIAVGTTIGVRTLQSSAAHVNFENALAVAETGVDGTLAQISEAYNSTPSVDYTSPSACAITAPSATFTDDDTERAWARDALSALPDSCLTTLPGGQYVAIRPTNRNAVYSMSWVPHRDIAKAKRRLIKAEYLFAPYKPTNAVLTQGGLDFSGSVAITSVSSTPSDVHSNSTIGGYNSSTSIAGSMSASGTLSGSCPSSVTGGCTAGAPIQALPNISARRYYDSQRAAYASNWYDLCPDGAMRAPAPAAGALPCTGSPLSTTNGWEFAVIGGVPTWTLPRTAGGPYNGIYYVYQGDAVIGSNGNSSTTWQISVLAEAEQGVTNPATCDKRGGNVTWRLFNLTPWLSGLQLLAEGNLTGDANASAGSGLFLAGDKVDLQTSSSTITGAVIAANSCAAAGGNTIQGVTINYDDTMETPLSDIIRTSLWLDYPAG